MKIKKSHYQALKNGMREGIKQLKPQGIYSGKELIDYYKNHNIGKNYTIRAGFDLLNHSKINGKPATDFICADLYGYLTDTHLKSAIVKIINNI